MSRLRNRSTHAFRPRLFLESGGPVLLILLGIVPTAAPAADQTAAPSSGAYQVLAAFLNESLSDGGIDRSKSLWQTPGRGSAAGSDMFPGKIDIRYLRYLIEVLYRVDAKGRTEDCRRLADAHVRYLAAAVRESHPAWAMGNALEAIGLHHQFHGGKSPYAERARQIVSWLRQRKVTVRLPDGTSFGHFPCGYGVLGAKDAGWTNDLSMVGAGLVWAFEVTGDRETLDEAASFAEYFVRPWRPKALGPDGYWHCGTWLDGPGTWVIGPSHYSGFESTDAHADEASWNFSSLTCIDYLARLYRHQADPRYLDRCLRAAEWTFRECQFADGAVGMCGRDDKWLGFSGAAVTQFALLKPHLEQKPGTLAPLLRDARRAYEHLNDRLAKADVKQHGVEWVNKKTSTDPLVNVGMLWTYALQGWVNGQRLFARP